MTHPRIPLPRLFAVALLACSCSDRPGPTGAWPGARSASIGDDGTAPYSDGIHHTAAGYEVRNAAIAEALAGFYPLP